MSAQPSEDASYTSWAAGWIGFAGVVMVIIGIFHALNGIVALVDDGFYIKTAHYTYELNTTAWGWIHLFLGVVIVIAGLGLFTGNLAARIIAVTLVTLSVIANFMWLPHYPVWSVIMISFDFAVIWALTAHGHDLADASSN